MQSIPSPTITESAVLSGFDFIILDCEHAVVDELSQLASLQTLSGRDAFSLARLRPEDFSAVGRYLDLGVNGILMPDIQSPEAAREFVRAATWGPQGTRSSTAASRTRQYGIRGAAPLNPLLLAMIEGKAGVEAVDRILCIEGIDGVVIGPHDLAADLGRPEDFSNP